MCATCSDSAFRFWSCCSTRDATSCTLDSLVTVASMRASRPAASSTSRPHPVPNRPQLLERGLLGSLILPEHELGLLHLVELLPDLLEPLPQIIRLQLELVHHAVRPDHPLQVGPPLARLLESGSEPVDLLRHRPHLLAELGHVGAGRGASLLELGDTGTRTGDVVRQLGHGAGAGLGRSDGLADFLLTACHLDELLVHLAHRFGRVTRPLEEHLERGLLFLDLAQQLLEREGKLLRRGAEALARTEQQCHGDHPAWGKRM